MANPIPPHAGFLGFLALQGDHVHGSPILKCMGIILLNLAISAQGLKHAPFTCPPTHRDCWTPIGCTTRTRRLNSSSGLCSPTTECSPMTAPCTCFLLQLEYLPQVQYFYFVMLHPPLFFFVQKMWLSVVQTSGSIYSYDQSILSERWTLRVPTVQALCLCSRSSGRLGKG